MTPALTRPETPPIARRLITRAGLHAPLLLVLAGLGAAMAAPAAAALPSADNGLDPAHTRFEFELRTHWGQRVTGTFPRYEGDRDLLPDGRQQVRLRLATADVHVAGSTRYTALARSARFFDAGRYPAIEFVSEPYSAALTQVGGKLRGQLSMHGVSNTEAFTLAPSSCARPGLDCDVVASGSVDRTRYGIDDWRVALSDTVRFTLRVRWRAPEAASP